jgi:hypothetical protein
MSHGERILVGGTANRGKVVRVGDTVRRPLRADSPAIHALLRHLEAVGFDGAPRVLDIDELGREVLSYIEGEAVIPPYPPWAMTQEALVSVAHLLRRYHEATTTFAAQTYEWFDPVPIPFRGSGVTAHNDPNLDNIVFRDGRAVALIDFDLAAPGSTSWEVANAARLWSPLRADEDIDDVRHGTNLERFRTFVDAYAVPPSERDDVVDAILAAHTWCSTIIREGADAGNVNFALYWMKGGAARAERTAQWCLHNEERLRQALR